MEMLLLDAFSIFMVLLRIKRMTQDATDRVRDHPFFVGMNDADGDPAVVRRVS
jgi:hypothetical protein